MVGPRCRDPRVDKRAVPMLLITISVGSGLAARRPREETARGLGGNERPGQAGGTAMCLTSAM